MNYCKMISSPCMYANALGSCKISACIRTNRYAHSSNSTNNLTAEVKRDDGVYAQVFAVKGGVRYDLKVLSLRDLSTTLTSSLMDGIEKLFGES